MDGEGAEGEIGAVEGAGDAERLSEFAGAACEVPGAVAADGHLLDAINGFEGADENAAGDAVGFGNDVEAFVDAVVQVDIGMARRTKNDSGARRDADGAVGGQVAGAEVSFGFDDDAGGFAMYEEFAQQRFRDIDGAACIK